MNRIVILVLLAACQVLALRASTQTFYVSPDGSDTQSGSRTAPFLSAAHAIGKAVDYLESHPDQNAEVLFAPGTYPVERTIAVPGSRFRGRLAIRSTVAGKAVLDGALSVDRFSTVRADGSQVLLKADLSGAALPRGYTTDYDRLEVYSQGERQQLARHPNAGFLAVDAVAVADGQATIRYADKRLGALAKAPHGFVHGFWFYRWYDQYRDVVAVDEARQTFTTRAPEPPYGFRKGGLFYAANAREFLDAAGEYYYDDSRKQLYWMVPSSVSHPQCSIPVSQGTCFLRLDQLKNCEVDGMVFRGGCNRAVEISGGEQVALRNCQFTEFGADAVVLSGGRGHSVTGCRFAMVGMSAISAEGGDRKTLQDAGFVFSDNIFTRTSYFLYCYQPAIHFTGCGATVSHNDFSLLPASAIRIDGNNVVVEHNRFSHIVLVSDDQGAFDMHRNLSFRGIVIRNNVWEDIRDASGQRKVAAVRLDDMISGVKVTGNLFSRCGSGEFGAVCVNGGRDNVITGNRFFDCGKLVTVFSFEKTYWEKELNDGQMQKWIHQDVDISSPAYLKAYPELKNGLQASGGTNEQKDNIAVASLEDFQQEMGEQGARNNIYQ